MNKLKTDPREKTDKRTEKKVVKILNNIILRKTHGDIAGGCCEKETNNC